MGTKSCADVRVTHVTHRPRTSVSTWARRLDGGLKTKVYLDIFESRSSVSLVILASPPHNMSAIIIPRNFAIHRHHQPEVLLQMIANILSIHEERVKSRARLAGAQSEVPPGGARASGNKIKVTVGQLKTKNKKHPLVAKWLQTDLNHFRIIYGLTDTVFNYFGNNYGVTDTDLALLIP